MIIQPLHGGGKTAGVFGGRLSLGTARSLFDIRVKRTHLLCRDGEKPETGV